MVAATLWQLDQECPTELDIAIPEDTHIICVHLAGEIDWSAKYADRKYRSSCKPNTLNLGRAGERARVVYQSARAKFLHFYLPQATLDAYLEDQPASAFELVDPANSSDPVIARIARQAEVEMGTGPASRLRLDAAGLNLAARLLDRWSTLSGSPTQHRQRDRDILASWQVDRVCDLMMATLDAGGQEPSLTDLAKLLDLTPAYICRAFAAAVGMPPHRWLLGQRVERARALLSGSGMSIADVAAAVGYDDPSYFARLFRRHTGITPLAFRRGRQE